MGIKNRFPRLYKLGAIMALGFLSATNYVTYKTMWKHYTTTPVPISSSEQLTKVIKGAKGNSLEEKIRSVINETIIFRKGIISEEFDSRLFSYLSKSVGNVKGKELTLEEKIGYAQMFSAELEYNYRADFVENVAGAKGVLDFLYKGAESAYEFTKIYTLSEEGILKNHSVVCGQFAKVFAAALNSINANSKNPKDIKVGVMIFVPGTNENYGKIDNFLISVVNATMFSEWSSSMSHATNIIATKDKVYIIEPQGRFLSSDANNQVHFDFSILDINNKYVSGLLK